MCNTYLHTLSEYIYNHRGIIESSNIISTLFKLCIISIQVGTLDYQINGYKGITVLSMEFFQNLNSPQLNNCPTSDIRKLF